MKWNALITNKIDNTFCCEKIKLPVYVSKNRQINYNWPWNVVCANNIAERNLCLKPITQ